MAKLTQSGLIIESLASILERKQQKAITIFSDIVPEGEVITTDSSSILGRMLQISAETDYLQEETLQEIYAEINPNSATGKNLDKIVQLKDMKRKPASLGNASLVLYGDLNVTVSRSSVVASRSTGDQFSLDSDVKFTNKNAAGVEIELQNVALGGKVVVSYTLNNDLSTNTPITIIFGDGSTKEVIASYIKTNIENQATKLKATVTNDINIQIKPSQDGLTGDFYVTGANIVRSFMPVNATSLYNVDVQETDSITTIQSSTFGWRGVTNLFPSLPSKTTETDDELRLRFYKATGTLATGHLSAMYTALYNVSGVSFVKITENSYDSIAYDGRAAHGFAVIVYGGNDVEIATAIEKTRPVGVPMDGNVTVSVNNYYTHTSDGRFSRPIQVPIKVMAALQIHDGFPASGMLDIKNAIIEHFNNMTFGEDVILSRLYIPLQSVLGVGVKSIQIAKGNGAYSTDDIIIDYNEIATVSFEDIEL